MGFLIEFLLIGGFFALVLKSLIDDARRKRVERAFNFRPDNAHGGARFATDVDLKQAGLFKRKGVPIGYSPDGKRALFYPGFGHLLTVAAARTGKGATLLVNALLSWKGSCICIDPKAENAAITAHFRRKFGPVYIVNPFGMLPEALAGFPAARINPMDILDTQSSAFHAMCDKLAAAIVWEEGKDGMHFTTAARALVSGVIAALKRHGKPSEQNLPAVARVVNGDLQGFCQRTVEGTRDPFIVDKLSRFAWADPESREVQDVFATARTQLAFLNNKAIADSLSCSDFDMADLKRKPGMTLFNCLPLNMLDVSEKYFRLILDFGLAVLLGMGQQGKKNRVLAIVDEMAQLGPHMKSLENAMGMAAGAAGLQLWCVLQDLSQLKGMFPQTWETFIQNCGVTTWFGARDQTTREYVSKLSGATEVVSRSRSVSLDRKGEPHVSDSMSQCARPLLLPHEAGALAADEMIAFVEGVRCGPVKAKRKFYFKAFWGGYRPNPYVNNAGLLRRIFG